MGRGDAGKASWLQGRQIVRPTMAVAALLLIAGAGCGPSFGPRAQHGITFYCPGIGNTDFGDRGVRNGLELAGYRGQVVTFNWTLAPIVGVVDQALRVNARLRSRILARYIREYIEDYPGRPVNIIGISAGTGVAIWALEHLDPKYKVDNVVLLASILHHGYDVSPALRRVRGAIYNYHSPYDAILAGPMKLVGTIDGVFGDDGAGAVGLRVPPGAAGRVINVAYRNDFQQFGYYGGHTDSTSPQFVRHVLSRHVIGRTDTAANDRAFATAED